MNIFFTSDHHFNHRNIIKYCARPFDSMEQMNEVMIDRWNAIVNPEDTVYYLGDFSLSTAVVPKYAPRLNGNKTLVMGNHDGCHPCHKKKGERDMVVYAQYFQEIVLEKTIKINDKEVLLHHMPYLNEKLAAEVDYDVRYAEFRPKDQGLWLLHGHVHEKWKSRPKMINVGVDQWDFSPVPWEEILKILP